jgi:hypothetical protein
VPQAHNVMDRSFSMPTGMCGMIASKTNRRLQQSYTRRQRCEQRSSRSSTTNRK